MGYSGAQGTLIYEKNLKSKISCQTPFKHVQNLRNATHKFKVLIVAVLQNMGQ